MFTHIVQRVNGLIMARYIRASMWVQERLFKLVSNLLASITQAYQNAANLLLRLPQLVRTTLSSNPLVVALIKAVQSIKVALTSVKASLIQIGSLLQTIVQTIRQPAPTAPSQKKGKPVGITKSARSRTKGSKTAQTPTAPLLTQAGTKLVGLVKQLPQHVKQLLKVKP
jgi:hypothetical protein